MTPLPLVCAGLDNCHEFLARDCLLFHEAGGCLVHDVHVRGDDGPGFVVCVLDELKHFIVDLCRRGR